MKKKTFLWNLPFYFFLERDSVQVSKYSMVTGVYPSHICFKGHHGITIEVSRDLKDRIEQYINKWIPYEFKSIPFKKKGIHHSKGSRLLKNLTFYLLCRNWISNSENESVKWRMNQLNIGLPLLRTWVRSRVALLFGGFLKQKKNKKEPLSLFDLTTWAGWEETLTSDFEGGNP